MSVLYSAAKDNADVQIVRKDVPSADSGSLHTLIYEPKDCTGNTPKRKYLKIYVKDADTAQIPYLSPMEAPSLSGLLNEIMKKRLRYFLKNLSISVGSGAEADKKAI